MGWLASWKVVLVVMCLAVIIDASGRFTNEWNDLDIERDDNVDDYVDDAGDAVDNATSTIANEAQLVMSKYKSTIVALMIPVGLVGCFLGYYLFSPFLFIGGALLGGGFFYLAVRASTEGTAVQGWLTIASSILGGLVVGVVAVKAVGVGIFLIGASIGAVVALALRHTVLYPTVLPADPQIALYITAVLLGILTGSIALCMEKQIVIIATSYGGAFATVYGIGHFAGHFPDLSSISQEDLNDQYLWIYFSAFIVLGSVGCFVQFFFTSEKNHRIRRSAGGWWHRNRQSDTSSDSDEEDVPARRSTAYSRAALATPKDFNVNVTVNQP